MLWDRCFTLYNIYAPEGEVTVHPAYFVKLIRDAVTTFVSIIAASGLFTGQRWGWSAAVFYCYWRISYQIAFPMIVALFGLGSTTSLAVSRGMPAAISAAVILGMVLYYLMRESEMKRFGVDVDRRLRSNGIAIGLAFPIAIGLELFALMLQRHVQLLPPGVPV
jgi:hypothetical protein